jgi:hypothetical protein
VKETKDETLKKRFTISKKLAAKYFLFRKSKLFFLRHIITQKRAKKAAFRRKMTSTSNCINGDEYLPEHILPLPAQV